MKRKISFKEWISVFFNGIGQFVCSVFSWKNKTPFWRVVWAAITICVVVVTGCICHAYYRELRRENSYVDRQPLSKYIYFAKKTYSSSPGWIYNRHTGERLVEGVDWVTVPENEDSLAVFSSKGRRGYLNRFSGKVSIAPQYDHAWIFSEGLAAVAVDGNICFIDHLGAPVNDRRFRYDPRVSAYVFHGDYCVMTDDDGLMGLIDRNGNWAVPAKYECIIPEPYDYWRMREGDARTGLWYAYDDKAQPVTDFGARQLDITADLGVVYTLPCHLKMVIGFDGSRVESFLCQDIEAMYYDTDDRDSSGVFIPSRCSLYRYRMDDGYEGLCRENGDIVTEPLYWEIRPVGKDLYHCIYKDSDIGVIINSDGKITEV